MGPRVRPAAWVLLFASLGAAAAAWFTPVPRLDAGDAADLAVEALAAADVDAELAARPRRAEHVTEAGDEVAVWVVPLDVRAGRRTEEIEVRVQRSAGRLVYVDDRIGPDDAERLLDDRQFAALGAHRDDSLADRWALRNGLGGLSAAIAAGTCYVLATRADRLREQP